MRTINPVIPALAWLALACPSLSAAIDGRGVTPIQFSLWHPAAIFGDEWAVAGLRFNLAYAVSRDLYGLDINTGYAVVEEDRIEFLSSEPEPALSEPIGWYQAASNIRI